MAEMTKMKTAKQARDKWGGIRKKLLADAPAVAANGGGGDSEGEGEKAGKAGAKKRKKGEWAACLRSTRAVLT